MAASGHGIVPNGGLRAVKTRKRPRLMSKARAAQMREYVNAKKEFLAKHKKCAIWPYKRATDVHHARGRRGKLLLDQRLLDSRKSRGSFVGPQEHQDGAYDELARHPIDRAGRRMEQTVSD